MSYRRANFLASSVTFVEWILLAGLAALPCFRRHRVPRTPATHTSSAGRGMRNGLGVSCVATCKLHLDGQLRRRVGHSLPTSMK